MRGEERGAFQLWEVLMRSFTLSGSVPWPPRGSFCCPRRALVLNAWGLLRFPDGGGLVNS